MPTRSGLVWIKNMLTWRSWKTVSSPKSDLSDVPTMKSLEIWPSRWSLSSKLQKFSKLKEKKLFQKSQWQLLQATNHKDLQSWLSSWCVSISAPWPNLWALKEEERDLLSTVLSNCGMFGVYYFHGKTILYIYKNLKSKFVRIFFVRKGKIFRYGKSRGMFAMRTFFYNS